MASSNQVTPLFPSALTPLSELQKRFGIIDVSGEIRVIDLEQVQGILGGSLTGEVAFYKKADAELLMKRLLENLPVACKPRQVIEDFWASPATRFYNATAFTPSATPDTTLNFWVGPTADAAPGNWRELRDFIRDIICAGDNMLFEYLIRYMAQMIQRPQDKPGVIITLLGGQGTGKGVFFSLLRAIWPRTTLQVSDIEQVTGRFNACLERNLVICMDEALFAGDRKSMDRLKSIVTESVIQIEQKYQPSRTIQSVHRFFASSNHSHFGNIEIDDRRFVFLQVSPSKQQDTTYFGQIVSAINDKNTLGALIYYLKRKDLKSFDVRGKPNTGEHAAQKLKSLQAVDRYWYEVLMSRFFHRQGKFPPFDDDEWSEPLFMPSTKLLENYLEFNRNAERHQTVQVSEVLSSIRRLCPSAVALRKAVKEAGNTTNQKARGLQLPDLETARREFEEAIGGKIAWD